jgi:hypothetical protein
VIGGYLYCWASNAGNKVLRITLADGTCASMTISGGGSAQPAMCSDGTYLYIAEPETTNLRKYSISGTDLTYLETITLPDKIGNTNLLACDGTYFFFCTYTTAGTTKQKCFYKTDLTGTEIESFYTLLSAKSYGMCAYGNQVLITIQDDITSGYPVVTIKRIY